MVGKGQNIGRIARAGCADAAAARADATILRAPVELRRRATAAPPPILPSARHPSPPLTLFIFISPLPVPPRKTTSKEAAGA